MGFQCGERWRAELDSFLAKLFHSPGVVVVCVRRHVRADAAIETRKVERWSVDDSEFELLQ